MQHVSSRARAAIISDGQTNTWHWFDLSICRAECRVTTAAGQSKTEEPLQYYARLLNVYAVHRFEYQLFTIKRWKGLKLPYAHGLQRSNWVSEFRVDCKRQKSLCNHVRYLHVECRNVNAAFYAQKTVPVYLVCFSTLLMWLNIRAEAASLWGKLRCFNELCSAAFPCNICSFPFCMLTYYLDRGPECITNRCFLFADRILEWVLAVCKYYGSAGLQRLLSGKPNDCGHYYYGTLSTQF